MAEPDRGEVEASCQALLTATCSDEALFQSTNLILKYLKTLSDRRGDSVKTIAREHSRAVFSIVKACSSWMDGNQGKEYDRSTKERRGAVAEAACLALDSIDSMQSALKVGSAELNAQRYSIGRKAMGISSHSQALQTFVILRRQLALDDRSPQDEMKAATTVSILTCLVDALEAEVLTDIMPDLRSLVTSGSKHSQSILSSTSKIIPLLAQADPDGNLLRDVLDLALVSSHALKQEKKLHSSLNQSIKDLSKQPNISVRLIRALVDGALANDTHRLSLWLDVIESLVSQTVSQTTTVAQDSSLSAALSTALRDALEAKDRSLGTTAGSASVSFFLMGLEMTVGGGARTSGAAHSHDSLDHVLKIISKLEADQSLMPQVGCIWPSLSFWSQMILDSLDQQGGSNGDRSLTSRALLATLEMGEKMVNVNASSHSELLGSKEELAMTSVASGVGIVRIQAAEKDGIESSSSLVLLSSTTESLAYLLGLDGSEACINPDEVQWAATSLSNAGIAMIQAGRSESASIVLKLAVEASITLLQRIKGSELDIKTLVDKRMKAHITAVAARGTLEASQLTASYAVAVHHLVIESGAANSLVPLLVPLIRLHARHRIEVIEAGFNRSDETKPAKGKKGSKPLVKTSAPPLLSIHLSESLGSSVGIMEQHLDMIAAEELEAIADESNKGACSSSTSKIKTNHPTEAAQAITDHFNCRSKAPIDQALILLLRRCYSSGGESANQEIDREIDTTLSQRGGQSDLVALNAEALLSTLRASEHAASAMSKLGDRDQREEGGSSSSHFPAVDEDGDVEMVESAAKPCHETEGSSCVDSTRAWSQFSTEAGRTARSWSKLVDVRNKAKVKPPLRLVDQSITALMNIRALCYLHGDRSATDTLSDALALLIEVKDLDGKKGSTLTVTLTRLLFERDGSCLESILSGGDVTSSEALQLLSDQDVVPSNEKKGSSNHLVDLISSSRALSDLSFHLSDSSFHLSHSHPAPSSLPGLLSGFKLGQKSLAMAADAFQRSSSSSSSSSSKLLLLPALTQYIRSLHRSAETFEALGCVEEAVSLLYECREMARSVGSSSLEAVTSLSLSSIERRKGDCEGCLKHLDRADKLILILSDDDREESVKADWRNVTVLGAMAAIYRSRLLLDQIERDACESSRQLKAQEALSLNKTAAHLLDKLPPKDNSSWITLHSNLLLMTARSTMALSSPSLDPRHRSQALKLIQEAKDLLTSSSSLSSRYPALLGELHLYQGLCLLGLSSHNQLIDPPSSSSSSSARSSSSHSRGWIVASPSPNSHPLVPSSSEPLDVRPHLEDQFEAAVDLAEITKGKRGRKGASKPIEVKKKESRKKGELQPTASDVKEQESSDEGMKHEGVKNLISAVLLSWGLDPLGVTSPAQCALFSVACSHGYPNAAFLCLHLSIGSTFPYQRLMGAVEVSEGSWKVAEDRGLEQLERARKVFETCLDPESDCPSESNCPSAAAVAPLLSKLDRLARSWNDNIASCLPIDTSVLSLSSRRWRGSEQLILTRSSEGSVCDPIISILPSLTLVGGADDLDKDQQGEGLCSITSVNKRLEGLMQRSAESMRVQIEGGQVDKQGKAEWWKSRLALDAEMRSLLSDVGEKCLGPLGRLLLSPRCNGRDKAWIDRHRTMLGTLRVGMDRIVDLLLSCSHGVKTEEDLKAVLAASISTEIDLNATVQKLYKMMTEARDLSLTQPDDSIHVASTSQRPLDQFCSLSEAEVVREMPPVINLKAKPPRASRLTALGSSSSSSMAATTGGVGEGGKGSKTLPSALTNMPSKAPAPPREEKGQGAAPPREEKGQGGLPSVARVPLCRLILVLSSELHSIPWESCPPLTDPSSSHSTDNKKALSLSSISVRPEVYRSPSLALSCALATASNSWSQGDTVDPSPPIDETESSECPATAVKSSKSHKGTTKPSAPAAPSKGMRKTHDLSFESDDTFNDSKVVGARAEGGGSQLSALRVNLRSTFFSLNPSGDLKVTQDSFEEWFTGRLEWKGVSGSSPGPKQLLEALRSHEAFIYCGHGSGEQYLPLSLMRRLQRRCTKGRGARVAGGQGDPGGCAASLLIGCSSGKLRVGGLGLGLGGSFDPRGAPLSYLTSGSPSVVVNLWDVTDRDIDRFCEATIASWTGFNKQGGQEEGGHKQGGQEEGEGRALGMSDAVNVGRRACRLPHLIGSAPVVYGVPTDVRYN